MPVSEVHVMLVLQGLLRLPASADEHDHLRMVVNLEACFEAPIVAFGSMISIIVLPDPHRALQNRKAPSIL